LNHSDEDETFQNEQLLKMMNIAPTSKKCNAVTDFEQEMEAELDRRAFAIEAEGGVQHQRSLSRSSSTSSLKAIGKSNPGSSRSELPSPKPDKKVTFSADANQSNADNPKPAVLKASEENEEEKFYDPVYFDSDDSDTEDSNKDEAKKKKSHPVLSNDDLFYDPDSDKRDQAWVDKQRRRYCGGQSSVQPPPGFIEEDQQTNSSENVASTSSKGKIDVAPLPKSDAILNCPACFSLLCMDCQRHEIYTGQYRAMFVQNCVISREEVLKVPCKSFKFKGKKRKLNAAIEENADAQDAAKDTFNPVKCKVCNTQVAMYDSEEVYHFFHILASHS